MPGEAWTFLGAVVVAIITFLVAPYVVARIKRKEKPPDPPPPDIFKDKWLARIDELEAEVVTERSGKIDCLVQCARLKTELKAAAKQRTADGQTIKRLRERVDRLERIVKGEHE